MIQKKVIFTIVALLFFYVTIAQKLNAIDQKGTKVSVVNNIVTDSIAKLKNANVNDIWFNSSKTLSTLNIFHGIDWISLKHKGTLGFMFFAGADDTPIVDNS